MVAVQGSEGGQPVAMKVTVVEGFRNATAQRSTAENVLPRNRVKADGLGCFRDFGAAGCEHAPQVTGAGRGVARGRGWISTALSNVKRSLEGTYHWLDPQCAALYLAVFQARFNRRYDLEVLPE